MSTRDQEISSNVNNFTSIVINSPQAGNHRDVKNDELEAALANCRFALNTSRTEHELELKVYARDIKKLKAAKTELKAAKQDLVSKLDTTKVNLERILEEKRTNESMMRKIIWLLLSWSFAATILLYLALRDIEARRRHF